MSDAKVTDWNDYILRSWIISNLKPELWNRSQKLLDGGAGNLESGSTEIVRWASELYK